jgi:hypothetical protein
MVYFQTKKRNLGKIWWVFQRHMLAYFMDIWSILRSFDTCYHHLVNFEVKWHLCPHFGTLAQKNWQPWVRHKIRVSCKQTLKLPLQYTLPMYTNERKTTFAKQMGTIHNKGNVTKIIVAGGGTP